MPLLSWWNMFLVVRGSWLTIMHDITTPDWHIAWGTPLSDHLLLVRGLNQVWIHKRGSGIPSAYIQFFPLPFTDPNDQRVCCFTYWLLRAVGSLFESVRFFLPSFRSPCTEQGTAATITTQSSFENESERDRQRKREQSEERHARFSPFFSAIIVLVLIIVAVVPSHSFRVSHVEREAMRKSCSLSPGVCMLFSLPDSDCPFLSRTDLPGSIQNLTLIIWYAGYACCLPFVSFILFSLTWTCECSRSRRLWIKLPFKWMTHGKDGIVGWKVQQCVRILTGISCCFRWCFLHQTLAERETAGRDDTKEEECTVSEIECKFTPSSAFLVDDVRASTLTTILPSYTVLLSSHVMDVILIFITFRMQYLFFASPVDPLLFYCKGTSEPHHPSVARDSHRSIGSIQLSLSCLLLFLFAFNPVILLLPLLSRRQMFERDRVHIMHWCIPHSWCIPWRCMATGYISIIALRTEWMQKNR